ncbi:hypothetical protein NQ317_013833 [Molorchus minor]|uniref:Odorant receptor n=1 Tax=Molorchus minor TaxID=1323400 RepID=A0ABQ9IY30_9CUCU|nr:hypothetical protein NQ317_013833 [Molorchus minor]
MDQKPTWYTLEQYNQHTTRKNKQAGEKTKELLLMSRKQIKVVVGLLTGHCALKGHLHRMGLYNGDLKCRLCNRETETAQHVLSYCETLDRKRQDIYGQPKLSPEDYITQPTGKLYKLSLKGSRKQSSCPEPTCWIAYKAAKEAFRNILRCKFNDNWTNRARTEGLVENISTKFCTLAENRQIVFVDLVSDIGSLTEFKRTRGMRVHANAFLTHHSLVFPKNYHFNIAMRASFLVGMCPFIFAENPMLQKICLLHRKFFFTYYMLFLITAAVKLFLLACDEVIIVDEIVSNAAVTLMWSITLIRSYVIASKRVQALVRNIFVLEERILNGEDERLIEIYNSHVNQNQITTITILVVTYATLVVYIIQPLFANNMIKYYPSRNETVIIKPLPLSSWFPFDEQENHLACYICQIIDTFFGAAYLTFSDIFNFSLIIFALGQIRLLKYILNNFETYVTKIGDQLSCSQEEASFITLRQCILKHKEIIWTGSLIDLEFIRVIELSVRLFRFDNCKFREISDINKVVSAEIPDPQETTLYNLVKFHMVHGPCGSLNPKSICMIDGKWKKKFPKEFIPETKDNFAYLFIYCMSNKYINEYNAAMRYVTFLEFLQSSVQLAATCLQLLMIEGNIVNILKRWTSPNNYVFKTATLLLVCR